MHVRCDVAGMDAVYLLKERIPNAPECVARTNGHKYYVFLTFPDERLCVRDYDLEFRYFSTALRVWNTQDLWEQLDPTSAKYLRITGYSFVEKHSELDDGISTDSSDCTTTEEIESGEEQCEVDTDEYSADNTWVDALLEQQSPNWTDARESVDAMHAELDRELLEMGVDPAKVTRHTTLEDNGIICVEEELDNDNDGVCCCR